MSLFLDLLDKKVINILKVLTSNPKEHFHIQKLSSRAKVPLSSTFRIVNRLTKIKVITITKINKFKIYQINEDKMSELKLLLGENK
ncbi:hypothetical protein HOE37_01440 [Candidatus Woesearchaeota archaeon]|jgi:hypothetical protein|nr:hypothetical protein [Candidatus Woesearchaeota archaeon]MBT4110500.1 hypothetical protein [Candidatus Woesearchaeota archaeon]MBT4335976.1 hypothetical protein [Candidatus Woesearchaeota archaeon]MBT4469045.1 hypothetical protein [Candidatus Woesearchaeota archaeon]MBT6744636.1 hypothetical protein [Candidatus Woesearchaeota archaeon]